MLVQNNPAPNTLNPLPRLAFDVRFSALISQVLKLSELHHSLNIALKTCDEARSIGVKDLSRWQNEINVLVHEIKNHEEICRRADSQLRCAALDLAGIKSSPKSFNIDLEEGILTIDYHPTTEGITVQCNLSHFEQSVPLVA